MNAQEMLTEIRRFHEIGKEQAREFMHIGCGTLEHWAYTLEQHLTPRVDGQPNRGEANVIQSATWIDDALTAIEAEMGQLKALVMYLEGLKSVRNRRSNDTCEAGSRTR